MPASSASQPSESLWEIRAGEQHGFWPRTREVWQYRRILWFFSLKSVQNLYAKTHLGLPWLFIRTLMPLAVGSFVFGEVMAIPSGGVPYFLFFLIGQVPWNCFDGPLIRASRGLEANRSLLTKLYVPRIILPLGQIASGVVDPVMMLGVLLGAIVYYRQVDGMWYLQADVRLLAAVASIVLILCFAFALSLWTSVWQARARDARFVLRYVVSFWMFLTPVIYPLSQVPAGYRWLMLLNPLTAPLETFRWALIPGLEHSWPWFMYSTAITLVTFAGGVWYFASSESVTLDNL